MLRNFNFPVIEILWNQSRYHFNFRGLAIPFTMLLLTFLFIGYLSISSYKAGNYTIKSEKYMYINELNSKNKVSSQTSIAITSELSKYIKLEGVNLY